MGLYFICTSPRSGGSVLCSTLSETGVLGTPASYVYSFPANEVLAKLDKEEFEDYLKKVPDRLYEEQHVTKKYSKDLFWLYETNILKHLGGPEERLRFFYEQLQAPNIQGYLENLRTSSLGGENWGIKILSNDNNYEGGFNYLIRHLEATQVDAAKKSKLGLLEGVDKDIKFIWLTRRNKIRQALSYWKADNSKVWHHYTKNGQKKEVEEILPTKEQLDKYVIQVALDDAHWEEFFSKNQISPHSIVYEDFILNPEKTIRGVFDHLGIMATEKEYFKGFKEFKMANKNSNELISEYYNTSFIW